MTTLAVTSVNSLLCHASTCFRMGSKLRCMRSTPTEMQSMSENDFECFARTGVNTPGTMLPNWVGQQSRFCRPRHPAKPRPYVPGKADYGTAKKVCRSILTEYPQSCPTRYEPGAGAEIPVRNEPGRGLREVRPVLVDSDLSEIHRRFCLNRPVRVCYNLRT